MSFCSLHLKRGKLILQKLSKKYNLAPKLPLQFPPKLLESTIPADRKLVSSILWLCSWHQRADTAKVLTRVIDNFVFDVLTYIRKKITGWILTIKDQSTKTLPQRFSHRLSAVSFFSVCQSAENGRKLQQF